MYVVGSFLVQHYLGKRNEAVDGDRVNFPGLAAVLSPKSLAYTRDIVCFMLFGSSGRKCCRSIISWVMQ